VRRRIVVTGSQGFVGRHLRRALEVRDCDVIGVDRPGSGGELELNLSHPAFDARALADRAGHVDGVIYLAATENRGSSIDAAARANLGAIATAAVGTFEAFASRREPPHFVYCSSFRVYGPQPGIIDPGNGPGHPDPHSYGAAKALAERLLGVAAARLGQGFTIVRPTCIYGPGQHLEDAIPRFLTTALDGRRPVVFGSGAEVRDDVFVPDVAYCLAEACLRRKSGAFHASGVRSRTILEVAEACCRAVELLGGPAVSPLLDPRQTPTWWRSQKFSWEHSRAELGYSPSLFDEALLCEASWIARGADPADSVRSCPAPKTRHSRPSRLPPEGSAAR
jgi:nucleoside-diphosphate-sugar epimerase